MIVQNGTHRNSDNPFVLQYLTTNKNKKQFVQKNNHRKTTACSIKYNID